jgi:hypothetical protein
VAAGERNAGWRRRDFVTEQQAHEFVRDLKGKPVAVHYDPRHPSRSPPRWRPGRRLFAGFDTTMVGQRPAPALKKSRSGFGPHPIARTFLEEAGE